MGNLLIDASNTYNLLSFLRTNIWIASKSAEHSVVLSPSLAPCINSSAIATFVTDNSPDKIPFTARKRPQWP